MPAAALNALQHFSISAFQHFRAVIFGFLNPCFIREPPWPNSSLVAALLLFRISAFQLFSFSQRISGRNHQQSSITHHANTPGAIAIPLAAR